MCAWTGLILPLYDLFVKINKTLHCLSTDSSFFFFLKTRISFHIFWIKGMYKECVICCCFFFLSLRYTFLSYDYKVLWKRDHTYGFWLRFPYCKYTQIFFNQKSKNLNIVFTNITKHISKTEQIQKRKKNNKINKKLTKKYRLDINRA